MIKKTVR